MSSRAPVNFRAFLVAAIAVTAAVFCVYLYMFSRAAGITVGCSLIVALACVFVLFAVRVKRGKAKLRVAIGLAIALILSVCAFAMGVTVVDERSASERYDGYYTVTGRVCAVDTRSGDYKVELEALAFDGKSVSGNMTLSIRASENNIADMLHCGDALTFYARVRPQKLFSDGYVSGYSYRTDIRFSASVGSDGVRVASGKPSLSERFSAYLRALYVENMGEKYGNLAYSMLTGDKHALYTGMTEAFSAVGLGHILAVSGLHIGFLIALLSFLLSRVDKRVALPIMLAVMIGYNVIADFSSSVVRASIMAVVSGATLLFGGRKDLLSSVLCAYSAILAVKPLYLFDVGFLLSFGAISGIAMFAPQIKRALVKRNAPNKTADAIGAATAVSVGILPSETCFFGKIHLLATVANVLLLPFVSIVFIATFCLTPIAAIPHCGKILVVCKYLFEALDYAAIGLASIPYTVVPLKTSVAVFAAYPIMFCASEFFMIERGKRVVTLYSVAACAAVFAVAAL